jgi:hypothetical protein
MYSITKDYFFLFKKQSLIQYRHGNSSLFLLKCALITFVVVNCVGLFDSFFLIKNDPNFIDSYRFKTFGLLGIVVEDTLTSLIVYATMALFLWLPLKIKNRKVKDDILNSYAVVFYYVLVCSIFELSILIGEKIIIAYDLHVLFSGFLFFTYFIILFFYLANFFNIGTFQMKLLYFSVFFLSISFVCVVI